MKHDKKVKLLAIVPSLGKGGAEVQVVNMMNQLVVDEFEKYLVSFENSRDLSSDIDYGSVKYIHFPRADNNIFYVAKKIARLIDEKKIDIIHCSLQIALLVGWLSRLMAERKPLLLVTLHTTLHRSWKDRFFELLIYQWQLRACDFIICVCQAQLIHWMHKFPFIKDKSEVIYNGVEPKHFDPNIFQNKINIIRKELGINENEVVLSNIAAFRPEKGHLVLLESFKRVLHEIPNALLLFVGDGATRKEIEKRAVLYNIADRVRFLGVLKDVRPVLSISAINIQASTAVETFSIAMLESLSMGVPMVATNIGGTSEAIIPEKTGILVKPGDVDDLTSSILLALKNTNSQFVGENLRGFVMQNFSQKVMVEKYSNVFRLMFGR